MWDGPKGKDPIESYSRDKNPAAAHRHESRHRRVVLSKRRPRTRKQTTEELIEDNRLAINRLYDTGKVTVIRGCESIKKEAWDEYARLWKQRFDLQMLLGSKRSSGMSFQIWHNGAAYSITPTVGNLESFLTSFNSPGPTPLGPNSKRDRIVWLLGTFRRSGFIEAGRAPTKTKGPVVKCVNCQSKHRYLDRPKNSTGVSRCPQCPEPAHWDVTGQAELAQIPKLTKAYLQRRFKLTSRRLARILRQAPTSSPTP